MSGEKKPTIVGINGIVAWKAPDLSDKPIHKATIAQWLVRGLFHPLWNHWALTVIHLRDIPGCPPASKERPNMTHEFVIVAIDPEWKPDWSRDDMGWSDGLPWLTPVDLVHQVELRSDQDAARLAEMGVEAMLNGLISPDRDYMRAWMVLLDAAADRFMSGRFELS